jgi:hypothetical protein
MIEDIQMVSDKFYDKNRSIIYLNFKKCRIIHATTDILKLHSKDLRKHQLFLLNLEQELKLNKSCLFLDPKGVCGSFNMIDCLDLNTILSNKSQLYDIDLRLYSSNESCLTFKIVKIVYSNDLINEDELNYDSEYENDNQPDQYDINIIKDSITNKINILRQNFSKISSLNISEMSLRELNDVENMITEMIQNNI